MQEDDVDDALLLEPDVEGLPQLPARPLAGDDLEKPVIEVQRDGAAARVDGPELPGVRGPADAVRGVARRARDERAGGLVEGQQEELVPLGANKEEVLALSWGPHEAEGGDATVDGDVDDSLGGFFDFFFVERDGG